MILREQHDRPAPWRPYIASKSIWARPFFAVEWIFKWVAYGLSQWSFLEVLEYLGSFSVLVAVIFYFSESGDRVKQKHYQAWQVINTAQHMGGSGGRIDALAELNADGVPLVGVDVSSAFLQGVQLPKARLLRANFNAADARNSNLEASDLSYANLYGANFRQSNLSNVQLYGATLDDGDFCGAKFTGSNLADATLDGADLGNADLAGVQWEKIKSIRKTNLAGVRNAPTGFLPWALKNGALQLAENLSCPVSSTNP
jgi:hypothetical protein